MQTRRIQESDAVKRNKPAPSARDDDSPYSSDFITPTRETPKRRRISASPSKCKHVSSDSDDLERDDLFDSSPPSRKRGFKRPRMPWSLVAEWSTSDYGSKEDIDKEIVGIMQQSMIDAKVSAYLKPNPNAIAGFRQKQVLCFTVPFVWSLLNSRFV